MDSREKEFAQLIKDNQGLIIKVSRLYTNSLEDEEDLRIYFLSVKNQPSSPGNRENKNSKD